ncbi:TetR family transcriptional regulator [Lacisediminimonas sp.]|uniref:TetR family transcriptional regulator n=1 Tax=Lacisediminimonas sp. TaxID=3060582 RepID=UPI0027217216|nr:TetR family transcriptional regulator [Lacisediminimonas sp.]MDO8300443.1 TetR family transcriptional regulator [Lacisediminimonas sp.]MDO9218250.1 TetR family transcriptional regulator [Lacisediminimonas sp.]
MATRKSVKPTADKAKPPAVRRSAEQARSHILNIAITEFAAKGFSGARIDAIAKSAQTNIRMLYHYFGSKENLYVAVLETVIAELRQEELKLDFSDVEPLAGLMQMFDFIDRHFSEHHELMSILSSENLDRAQYIKKSSLIPTVSSPVLTLLDSLLKRGVAAGSVAPGIDPLHLYVTLVAMAYYHKSNAHTLSYIFKRDLTEEKWQAEHRAQTDRMLLCFLRSGSDYAQIAMPADRRGVLPGASSPAVGKRPARPVAAKVSVAKRQRASK